MGFRQRKSDIEREDRVLSLGWRGEGGRGGKEEGKVGRGREEEFGGGGVTGRRGLEVGREGIYMVGGEGWGLVGVDDWRERIRRKGGGG